MAPVDIKVKADAKQAQKEIGKLDKQLKGFKENTEKQVKPLKDMKSGLANVGMVAGVAVGALYAAKKAFDFGKEGAELEFVRGKFDRLAESVGTTSDVLMTDLKKATRGTMSDMQLAAGATDFMSLGLAKNREEVVRLTRVAGALGMNLNQLVLTLTNKTTMRFDALGVAVDGFDEKVKELEKSGLSVQDAFTEAFLQQAEEQIIRVGDVADTNAGQIMQMDAAWANLTDTLKLGAAPAVADIAEELTNVLVPLLDNINFGRELGDALERNIILEDEWKELLVLYTSDAAGAALATRKLTGKVDLLDLAMEQLFEGAGGIDPHFTNFATTMGEVAGLAEDAAAANRDVVLSLQEVDQALLAKEAIDKLNEAYDEGKIDVEEYKSLFVETATMIGGLDSDSVKAQLTLFDLQTSWDEGKTTISEYIDEVYNFGVSIDELPTSKTIDIIVNYKTQGEPPEFQGGGSFIVPPGFTSHPMMIGVHSGERVDVTPGGQVTNTTNNYNEFSLNNYTNSDIDLIDDFALLQVLAGA